MPVINSALGLVGLATRQQLRRAVDRKDRWHGLVRDVFGQYYLKFRESALSNMPELPGRYSADWERHIRAELDEFLALDLESVGALLDACGFGTQKWEKLQETGFPALRRLMDQVAEGGELPSFNGNSNGKLSDAALTAVVDEDVLDLLQRHPKLAHEFVRRVDVDSGLFLLDDDDLRSSDRFRQLQAHHEAALEELRRFRRGGKQALSRIQQLQQKVDQLQTQAPLDDIFGAPEHGHGHGHTENPDHEREVATLCKQLRAREASSAALRSRIDALESRLAEGAADPDAKLRAALASAKTGIEERDDTIVRLQARLERWEKQQETWQHPSASRDEELASLREQLQQTQTGDHASAGIDLEAQLRELQSQLQARDHKIETLRSEIETLQQSRQTSRSGSGTGDESDDDAGDLRNLLTAREHTISGLRGQIAQLEVDLEGDTPEIAASAEATGDIQQLRNDLRARDHQVETLQAQVAKFEADLERHERRAGSLDASDDGNADLSSSGAEERLTEQVKSLQHDLSVRDQKVVDLRKQLHAFEAELGQARDHLLVEVNKLKALTSGELELKPADELDTMDSEELLDYARDVAEDLDVRRQTLDEGLQGIDSVKGSYEESQRVYQEQEARLQEQLENMRVELETMQSEQESGTATGSADEHETIVKQREQLDLLSTRIRQLVGSNHDINESNKKMYENLEQAVKRMIPLRKQIEELDSLNEALQRYIRQTHDRTFTTRKLTEAGVH